MFLRSRESRSMTPTGLPAAVRAPPAKPYSRTGAGPTRNEKAHLTPARRRSSAVNARNKGVRAKPAYRNGDNPFAASAAGAGSSSEVPPPGGSPPSPTKSLVDKYLPRYNREATSAAVAPGKRIQAPATPGQCKPVLVLDMDETLCHTTFSPTHQTVTCRPYLDNFLEAMASIYEVVVFTAGTREYANCVLDHMDTSRTLISRRFFRDSCRVIDGVYCKDLRKVVADKDPTLDRVLIIDNIPENYSMQPDLGIPISDFFGEEEDSALLHLIPFLQQLCKDLEAGTPVKDYLATNMGRLKPYLKEGYCDAPYIK